MEHYLCMNHQFLLDSISVHLRKVRRAKRLTLRLITPAQVNVTIPYFVSFKQAHDFVLTKTDWIYKTANKLSQSPKKQFTQDNGLAAHKDDAQQLIASIIEKYTSTYPYAHKKVFVKNLKTRWGSCSSAQNLNFNYRLVFLPERLAEYVVVHELCHLKEMNHGPNFWKLVTQKFPDYKQLRKQLREYSFYCL